MHYIYHVPGVKIGCTNNIDRRMSEQGFSEWEILEQHADPQAAGDREWELQDEYGFPRDTRHYTQILAMGEKGLANVQYENRICFNSDHQKNASMAGHLAKLKYGTYNKIGKMKRKLSDDQVRDIRLKEIPQRAYAKKYNVSQRTITQIQKGITYIDVQ